MRNYLVAVANIVTSFAISFATCVAISIAIFAATQPVFAGTASCDLRTCMSVCESGKAQDDNCPGMCSRIITMCTQIVREQAQERVQERPRPPKEIAKETTKALTTGVETTRF